MINLAAGDVAARGQLAANTEQQVQFAEDLDSVEICGDGSADIYFTVDGSAPSSSSQKSYRVFGSGSWNRVRVSVPTSANTEVRLISTGTPAFEVNK